MNKMYKTTRTKPIEGTHEWMMGFSVSKTGVQIPARTLVAELVTGKVI